MPYFGYARQDRRPRATRVPITAKLVANMMASAGVHRLLTVDLHADQIQGSSTSPWTTSPHRCCWARCGSQYDDLLVARRSSTAAWCGTHDREAAR